MANLVCGCGCWFDEGVCPSCGKSQEAKRVKPKRGTLKERKQQQRRSIEGHIGNTPGAAAFKGFVSEMFKDYGIPHAPTVYRNIQGGYHHTVEGDRHQIVMGWNSIADFWEYSTYTWLWDFGSERIQGLKAVWACAIHEVAHAIQHTVGGRWRGSAHNSIWADKVEELQEMYPFEDFEAKYK
jgi:hypothetical protein